MNLQIEIKETELEALAEGMWNFWLEEQAADDGQEIVRG